MAAVGAGILWLGWNGFNGGDPYYAGSSAAGAVINTNLATAVGVLVWIAMDAWLSKERKPTFLGGVNGMICGLVGITPCAGWVSGWGAIIVGATCTVVVWFAWNYLSKVPPFSRVDDALGVVYTHGIAGFMGGMLLGIFADPNMVETGCGRLNSAGQVINSAASTAGSQAQYLSSSAHCSPFGVQGLLYTGSAHQLWEQFRAAVWVICWSAVVTFILMWLIKLVLRGAKYKDEVLEVGDLGIHGEEAFPEETFAMRSDGAFAMAGVGEGRAREPEPPSSGGDS
jgi:Amt family ammonium transporter